MKCATDVDGCAENVIPLCLVHRHAFAREHCLIDAGPAVNDHSVHRDLLAWLDQKDVADLDVVNGNISIFAVPDDVSCLGPELDELFDGFAGLTAASGFEVSAEQNERGDNGTGFKVQMVRAGIHRPGAVEERSECAQ